MYEEKDTIEKLYTFDNSYHNTEMLLKLPLPLQQRQITPDDPVDPIIETPRFNLELSVIPEEISARELTPLKINYFLNPFAIKNVSSENLPISNNCLLLDYMDEITKKTKLPKKLNRVKSLDME